MSSAGCPRRWRTRCEGCGRHVDVHLSKAHVAQKTSCWRMGMAKAPMSCAGFPRGPRWQGSSGMQGQQELLKVHLVTRVVGHFTITCFRAATCLDP